MSDNYDNIETKAASLLESGLVESFRKDYNKAINCIEEAQKIFNETKNIRQIVICLAELAIIYYKVNNDRLIRSLTLLNDAKYLIKNLPEDERPRLDAKILHYYGLIYYLEKRYSDALKYYNQARALLTENTVEYAKILDDLAIFYLRINNYQISVDLMKQSLQIKKNIGNVREISITQLLLGRYYSAAEQYEDASKHLQAAVREIEEIKDNHTSSRIWGELAKIQFEMNEYKKAEEYAQKSVKIAKKIDLPLVSAFSNCIIANINVLNKNIKTALELLEHEIEPVFSKFHSQRGMGLAKQIRASIHDQLGQTKDAIEFLYESIELFNQAHSRTEAAKSYFNIGMVYKSNSDYPKASVNFKEALAIAKDNNLYLFCKKIEDMLFEVDEQEWSSVIDKTANKHNYYDDAKAGIDAIQVIGDFSHKTSGNKDPFLALLRIGRSIAAETDLDKLLTIIARETQKALSADRCTVFLLDKDKNELWSKIALGMGSQEIRFPANTGLAGHVVMTGETINIKDAYNDSRFNKDIDKQTGYKTKTILCMPMRNLNHEIIGVFQVLNKFGNEYFTAEDEDLLIAIGSSTGIALENARLFKRQKLMYDEQKRSFVSFINTLAASIDARDRITAGHSSRVTLYSIAIAENLGIEGDEIEALEHAALLHDIGKIGIRDSVLCKQGKLTEDEYKHIQEHADITYEILNNMFFEEKLKNVPEIAASHHEKMDGSGYCRGLKGEEICLGGRILAVSDVFDAITSKRHYRQRMPFLNVLNILKKDTGTHFDENVIKTFFSLSLFKIMNILLYKEEIVVNEDEQKMLVQYNLNQFHKILLKDKKKRTKPEKDIVELFDKLYNPHKVL